MMKHVVVAIIVSLSMIISSTSLSYSPTNLNAYYPYGKRATALAKKLIKVKDKYHLDYKDTNDLLDTCSKITKYAQYSKHFDSHDVATIILKESRFNQFAKNKSDGGIGLGQLTKIKVWHKDTLFWITDPYDKDQNIIGTIIVLEDNYRCWKKKNIAIRRYNGSSRAAKNYERSVISIKKELKRIKA